MLRQIIKKDGVLSLYKGLQSAIFGTMVSFAIYFFWYRYFKNKLAMMRGGDTRFSSIDLTAITAASGIISSVCSNPIWMINTRMAIAKEKIPFFSMVKEIYENEGISAFFKGVLPNLILVINPIINFVIYE